MLILKTKSALPCDNYCGFAMQKTLDNTRPESEISGALNAGAIDHNGTVIDPMTLATLDIGLFKCLENIGTSRQRVCSALFLSYAEYDYISRHLKTH
jgi:hypothetical protein